VRYAPLRKDAILPLVLIGIGVIALLVNGRVLSQQALVNLSYLWPLLLVAAGIALILRALLPAPTAAAVSLGAAAAILAAALIVAIAGPPIVSLGSATLDRSGPLGAATPASLLIDAGASTATIAAADLGRDAYRVHGQYSRADGPPRIDFDPARNALAIRSAASRSIPFFQPQSQNLDLTLSTHVPWSLSVEGGAANLRLDLGELKVAGLRVGGGASDLDATLGTPVGTALVGISGGASSVSLHLPSGSQWRVRVSGGASSVSVDGNDLSGGDQVTRSSSGFATAADRYDIEITGGASDVSVDTTGNAS
jgi:hypothetical protein